MAKKCSGDAPIVHSPVILKERNVELSERNGSARSSVCIHRACSNITPE
jgi:hypothetical protein